MERRLGNLQPAHHTAGVGVDDSARRFGEVHGYKGFVNPRPPFPQADTGQASGQHQVLIAGEASVG